MSKRSIQEIKVGLASFNADDSGQDSYLQELNKERSKYNKLLRDLGVVKGRNKQITTKNQLKNQLEELREEKRGTSHSLKNKIQDKLRNQEFKYDTISNSYKNNDLKKIEQKQIIDSIIY